MPIKAHYFAWVRERIGVESEDLSPPDTVLTVRDMIAWLKGRGEHYAYAFENEHIIRAALDKKHVKPDAAIGTAREIAFFPPMTGG